MGVVLGLLLGTGLATVWWSFWPAPVRVARPPSRWRLRVGDMLAQAGVRGVGPAGLVATSLGVGIATGLVLLVLVPAGVAGCFAAFAAFVPWFAVRGRARRKVAARRTLWPDVVDHLASAIRAGLALPEAVAQLAERGPVELREPFRAFAEDYRATGQFGQCLDLLKDRFADPVADRIVEALRMTRDVGGTDLGRLLRTLSSFLRDDLRVRGELEARQSWTVNAARLAVAAPWLVLALLIGRPEAAKAYGSMTGSLVLVAGAACSAVAYWLMQRVARLPEDPRVLR
ncbi:MAG: type II secretion system F family protein [Actinobacteria bacterium]|nr:type II secretion system F family protein [Actinomycetota bacterium]